MTDRAADVGLARVTLATATLAVAACAAACAKDKADASPLERGTSPGSADLGRVVRAAAACGPRGLPPDRHFVAEGHCVRVVALEQGPLRAITFAANGDLLAVTSGGELKRYRDVDHDGLYGDGAPESVVWATTGGDSGHDCFLDGRELYCGSKNGVKRWLYAPELDEGGPGDDVVVGVPDGGRHSKDPVAVWDGFLYVASGSADNAASPMPADYDTNRGVVKRFPIDKLVRGRPPLHWKDGEVVVRGVHNVTAMARDPGGHLLGIDNGMDDAAHGGIDVRQDNPAEAIVALEPDKRYGYPFCFFAQRIIANDAVVAPGTPLARELKPSPPGVQGIGRSTRPLRDDAWCAANVERPMSLVQAHSSALGMTFPQPGGRFALADRWRRGAFVALHGSWDRESSTGHKVIWIPFDASGKTRMPTSTQGATVFPYEVVFGGGKYGAPRDGEWAWKLGDAGEDAVRPASVAISPVDGALYVASDNAGDLPSTKNGAIYRISLLGR